MKCCQLQTIVIFDIFDHQIYTFFISTLLFSQRAREQESKISHGVFLSALFTYVFLVCPCIP